MRNRISSAALAAIFAIALTSCTGLMLSTDLGLDDYAHMMEAICRPTAVSMTGPAASSALRGISLLRRQDRLSDPLYRYCRRRMAQAGPMSDLRDRSRPRLRARSDRETWGKDRRRTVTAETALIAETALTATGLPAHIEAVSRRQFSPIASVQSGDGYASVDASELIDNHGCRDHSRANVRAGE